MNSLSLKNQKKVLNILIDMCDNTESGVIHTPVGFESRFPFLDAKNLDRILDILSNKEFISLLRADYPDNFDIASLSVTPEGLNFIPQTSYDNRQKWLERLWGFLTGSLFTAIISALLR